MDIQRHPGPVFRLSTRFSLAMKTLSFFLTYVSPMKLFLLSALVSTAILVFVIKAPAGMKHRTASLLRSGAPTAGVIPKRYLALGDSYTIGESVTPKERFPYLTDSLLRLQHITIQDPQYIATTGWTTVNLYDAINNAGQLGIFDAVTLMIGVNDQFQHIDTAAYRVKFTRLLRKGIALAGNRAAKVFVLSIPDYSATPYVDDRQKVRVSREIDLFNLINKEVTLRNHIIYIDITPLTREVVNDSTLLCSDGLHYSAKEHQKWAELLAPHMKNVL